MLFSLLTPEWHQPTYPFNRPIAHPLLLALCDLGDTTRVGRDNALRDSRSMRQYNTLNPEGMCAKRPLYYHGTRSDLENESLRIEVCDACIVLISWS